MPPQRSCTESILSGIVLKREKNARMAAPLQATEGMHLQRTDEDVGPGESPRKQHVMHFLRKVRVDDAPIQPRGGT